MGPQERKLLLFGIMAGLLVLVRIFGKWFTNYYNAKEQQDEANKNIIRQPLYYLIAGLFSGIGSPALFTFMMIVPAANNEKENLPIFLLVLFLVCTLCISGILFALLRLNWRVEIQEDGFTYRNLFRVTKHYLFEEITEKYMGASYRYYKGKKKILTISALQPNCFLLSQALSKWKKAKREEEKQRRAEERQRKAEERQRKAEERQRKAEERQKLAGEREQKQEKKHEK